MTQKIDMNAAYRPSENLVAREIEGELIIVPITSGIGDMEDELYTLNATGKTVWYQLDGKTPLSDLVTKLAAEYNVPEDQIAEDVRGLMQELTSRNMVVKVAGA